MKKEHKELIIQVILNIMSFIIIVMVGVMIMKDVQKENIIIIIEGFCLGKEGTQNLSQYYNTSMCITVNCSSEYPCALEVAG